MLDRLLASAIRVAAACARAVEWIPSKARLAVLAGFLVLLGLAVYMIWFSGSATLNLVCHHSFRSAELSVYLDGRLAYSGEISGSTKKRFGVLDKRVEGRFSKSLAVSPGDHVAQVQLKSVSDGFEQTKSCGVSIPAGKDATLLINAQHSGMSLIYDGPPVAPLKDLGGGAPSPWRSLLVTVGGSALSAVIGFMVQEFLRSRRAARALENQRSKTVP